MCFLEHTYTHTLTHTHYFFCISVSYSVGIFPNVFLKLVNQFSIRFLFPLLRFEYFCSIQKVVFICFRSVTLFISRGNERTRVFVFLLHFLWFVHHHLSMLSVDFLLHVLNVVIQMFHVLNICLTW